jgi:hypothetical protein
MDTGVWEGPIRVDMRHSDGTFEPFVDPSPILEAEGRIVLFYLVGQIGADPARCLPTETNCTRRFRSATEVSGSDGAAFVVDSGDRAAVAITSNETASDPDVFAAPGGFVMYISRGGSVQALSSTDLRGSYANVSGLPGGILVSNAGGVPAGHYDSATGSYWTYVHQRVGSASVIRRAVHSSITAQVSVSQFSTVLSGASFLGLGSSYWVESPGFAVNDGGPAPTPTRPPVTASETRTPTPPVQRCFSSGLSTPVPLVRVGGQGLSLRAGPGGSTTLRWLPGAEQTGYLVLRLSGGPPEASSLPCEATTHLDASSARPFSCYLVVPLRDLTVLGVSDLLCTIRNLARGAAPSEFAILLSRTSVADLSWPSSQDRESYILLPLGGVPVPIPGSTTFTRHTMSGPTCYVLVSVARDGALGNTDAVCGVPGIGTLG